MAELWDVIIVGGGVVGSAAAYHCAKQGLKTLLLEQVGWMGHTTGLHNMATDTSFRTCRLDG